MARTLAIVVVASAVAACMPLCVAAQAKAAAEAKAAARIDPSWQPPMNAWGQPDLQGIWTTDDMRGIPQQRAPEFGTRQHLTDEEFAARGSQREGARETQDRGAVGTFRNEEGTRTFGYTSMVIDPPDGRIPPLTPQAQQRLGGRAGGRGRGFGESRADSWLDRSFYDRCITRGLPGSMMPAIYGNAYDITQAPGLVAIRYEMIHETRVIRLDDSPRTGMRSHMGEARGRWEGNTLVVETTNFDPRTVYQNGSAKLTMVERYRPVTSNKIEWSVTLNDPDTWTKPWTFGMTLTADPEQPLFEYACHEGNYAMRNILSAARAEEARGGK